MCFVHFLLSTLSWVVFPGVGMGCLLGIGIHSQGLTGELLLRRTKALSSVTSLLLVTVTWSPVVAQMWRVTELEQSESQAVSGHKLLSKWNHRQVNKSGPSLIGWGMWRPSLLPPPSCSPLPAPQTLVAPVGLMGFLAQMTMQNLCFPPAPQLYRVKS